MTANKKITNILIIIFILLEIFLSGYLIYKNLTAPKDVCIVGSGCDQVQDSKYGSVFGIKLPYYALFCFIVLLILFFVSKRLFALAATIGVLISLYLIYLQLFVLKMICSSCILIDASMIIIFILMAFGRYYKKS